MRRRRDGKCHKCDETAITKNGYCYEHEPAKHRLPEKIVSILEDALESAELKLASFDGVGDTEGTTITIRRADGWKETFNGSITEFIRERTRLYRGSWIIHRIQEVLVWSKTTDDGSMLEYELLRRVKDGNWPHPDNLDEMIKEVETLRERNGELEAFKRRVDEASARLTKEIAGG